MRWIKVFLYSTGALMLAAALERFLVAGGDSPVLSLPEPLLGLPLRYAVLLTGILELTVALICLFGRSANLQLGWLAWMTVNYLIYRIALLTMHIHSQCTGVGTLTDPLHLARGTPGLIIRFIPLYLLLGSGIAVVWLWLSERRAKSAKYLKMSCPACGVHIRFDDLNLGKKIPCPHCQHGITLRQPGASLKIACFFCREHIEFPAHALGEKMPCPHCKMDITLKEPA